MPHPPAVDLSLLQRVPIFGALTPETLTYLLTGGVSQRLAPGEPAFLEGDNGDGVYVIRAGTMTVQKGHATGLITLRTLREGDCFGEVAMLAMVRRTATVRALEPTRLLWLPTALLMGLHDRAPEQFTLLVMNLAREVCRRLQRADERLFHLAPDAF